MYIVPNTSNKHSKRKHKFKLQIKKSKSNKKLFFGRNKTLNIKLHQTFD